MIEKMVVRHMFFIKNVTGEENLINFNYRTYLSANVWEGGNKSDRSIFPYWFTGRGFIMTWCTSKSSFSEINIFILI